MKEHPAWGVDLTAVTVRGVKLERRPEGKPRLVAWDIVDFTEQVEDVSSIARFGTMARGLFHFRSRHELRSSRVWISLRAETAFNRTVTVPGVSDESLDSILEYEAQQQVPFPLEEVYWDRRVLAIREDGEVLATLYAVRRALIEDRVRKMQKAKVPVDGVQLRPLALHNFCAFERLLDNGTVVVDVDYGGLQVLVHHDERTWFRALPLGGVDLVDLLAKTFQCGHPAAVRMAAGDLSPPDAEVFEASRRKVAQMVAEEVQRTVAYYTAARPGVRTRTVVLFESHPCVPPMAEALKKALGLPVFRPRGFREIEVDPDVVTAGIQENFPALVKATGLALQGIGRAEVEVRLFSSELQRSMAGRRLGYVAAGVILLLLVALVSWRHAYQTSVLDAAREDLRSALAEGHTMEELEHEVRPSEPLEALAMLEWPPGAQARPQQLVDQLYGLRARWDSGPAPHIVSISCGSGDQAELVLAVPQVGAPEEAEQSLEAFAQALQGSGLVRAVSADQAWTAGRVTAEPEEIPPDRVLRWRFRHRRYLLNLGEGGP